MKLEYQSEYFSIKHFEPVEINDFTVLTGLNGSGKTHLLMAIKNGNIEIENIDKAQIIYYNYNDFTIFTGASKPDEELSLLSPRPNELVLEKIKKLRIEAISAISKDYITRTDKIVYQLAAEIDFNFNNYFNFQHDYLIINEIKKEGNIKEGIQKNNARFSRIFCQFLNEYIWEGEGNINDIDHALLKARFEQFEINVEISFKERNKEFYDYIKNAIGDNDIFNLTINDFEIPQVVLDDIANEERNYQYLKSENSSLKARAEEWNDGTLFLTKVEFIDKYGISPIEQINEVLKQYDCNGYLLTNNNFIAGFGISKKEMPISICLINENGFITTFDRLSSGEKILMTLSLLIYKSQKKKILPMVLLLDEIDSSLHPSMINRLLGVIQKIFIEKQGLKVVLATHSPTTVALSPEDSIFIVSKTDPRKILKQDKASAINILTEGFAALTNEDSNISINYNIAKTDLPILFTEGITDKIILEIAWEKNNGLKSMPFYIQDCFDAIFLGNLFSRGHDVPDGIFSNHPDRVLISLFDFDGEGYNRWNGLKKIANIIENDPNKGLTKSNGKKVYAMLLPVPDNEEIKKQVIKSGVETFENESILTIELMFYGVKELDQYFRTEHTSGGGQKIVFKGEKRDFTNQLDTLDKHNFNSFIPLFSKLDTIINQ